MRSVPWRFVPAGVLLFLLYVFGLSRAGMLEPDEPRYAAIGREMAATGDWITPRLFGEPWFEKPALLYWLIGAGFRTGLDEDLAPRLPVALISVAFLCFFYARVTREFGARAAAFSSAMLATSIGWLAYSHIAVTDIPLSACFASSMLLCLGWIRSGGRRGLLLAGALLGMAVLAKGLVPLVLALPLLWIGRRESRDLLLFGLACVAVALPWYALCFARNGWPFLEEFFLRHHFSRFTTGEQLHRQPFWYYVPVFLALFLPWSPLLALLRRRWITRDRRLVFIFLWLAFGFVFFSASSGKLPGYILPLLPAAALLAGVRASELANGGVWLGLCAVPLALLPVAAEVLPNALAAGLSASSWPGLNLAAAGIAAAIGFIAWRYAASVGVVSIALAVIANIVWLKWDVFPKIDQSASARPLWHYASSISRDICVGDLRRSWIYGLNYYAGRVLPACEDKPAFLQILPSAAGPIVVPRL